MRQMIMAGWLAVRLSIFIDQAMHIFSVKKDQL